MASSYNKFKFDTDFFELVNAGGKTEPVAKTMDVVLEEARQQAYAEGLAAGQAQGQASAQDELNKLQQQAHSNLQALQDTLGVRERALTQQILGLVRGSLIHLLGQAARHFPDELLAHHLQSLVPLAKSGEVLVLRIHPQARAYHEKLGLPQANILGVPMQIVTDAALGPTDVVLEWQHGGLESKLARQEALILEHFAAAGAAQAPLPSVEVAVLQPDPHPSSQAAPQASFEEAVNVVPSLPDKPMADDAVSAAQAASAARAAALLGDDELHDALKN